MGLASTCRAEVNNSSPEVSFEVMGGLIYSTDSYFHFRAGNQETVNGEASRCASGMEISFEVNVQTRNQSVRFGSSKKRAASCKATKSF